MELFFIMILSPLSMIMSVRVKDLVGRLYLISNNHTYSPFQPDHTTHHVHVRCKGSRPKRNLHTYRTCPLRPSPPPPLDINRHMSNIFIFFSFIQIWVFWNEKLQKNPSRYITLKKTYSFFSEIGFPPTLPDMSGKNVFFYVSPPPVGFLFVRFF